MTGDESTGSDPAGEGLDIASPPPATWRQALRVRTGVLRSDASARRLLLWPMVAALATLVLALIFAPVIRPSQHARFENIFGTSAQVLATLLVALAVEARALRVEDSTARRLVTGWTLGMLALGLVASVVALNPALTTCAYRVLFGLTMAAGIGALLSVLGIAFEIFEADFARATGRRG